MTLGEKIRALRESLELTQTDLAKRVGITKQLLYKYENEIITNIPQNKVERLAIALHTSPTYLMGWTEKVAHEQPEFFHVTDHEKSVIIAYRQNPQFQAAIDTMLGIADEKKNHLEA